MASGGLWNNTLLRAYQFVLLAGLALSGAASPQDTTGDQPKLLLSPQRLRRLERQRERQTVRWVDFENRVNSVPDSSERGFELALYYAITKDEKRGREAIEWALAHQCDRRQAALVMDWCAALLTPNEKQLLGSGCANGATPAKSSAAARVRDALFAAAMQSGELPDAQSPEWKQVLADLKEGRFADGPTLYEVCEYLTVYRSLKHVDLRTEDARFFSSLPTEFLLSLKPGEVQHPDWITHVAGLALVALDPNLESSQFLQGWAIEQAQMLREGPGVAYELLWADPYLPGVGYQNLDSWLYDEIGRLFARSSWNPEACWIEISKAGVEQQGCPRDWQNVPAVFGHLTLAPLTGHCVDLPVRKRNESALLWRSQPHAKVFYLSGDRKEAAETDAAGMWRVPENVGGRVCVSLDKLKRP